MLIEPEKSDKRRKICIKSEAQIIAFNDLSKSKYIGNDINN